MTDPLSDTVSLSTSGSNTIYEDTGKAGTYTLSCSATDFAGNTNSASTDVTVKAAGPSVKRTEGDFLSVISEKIRGLDQKTLIIIIVVILVVAFVASGKKT